MKYLLAFLLLGCLVQPASAQFPRATYNVAYGDDPRQKLDIYVPEGLTNFPVLVFVSGGGWTTGSKEWIANVGMTFPRYGIGVVAVDHRLVPQVEFPANVEDVARAVAWVLEHAAEFGGDPTRIIIGGHSAGGHLTALVATDPQYLGAFGHRVEELRGVIAISAVLDVMNWRHGDEIFGDTLTRWNGSPVHHVQAGVPPFLLLVAQADSADILHANEQMETALHEADVPAERYVIAGRDHLDIVAWIGARQDEPTHLMLAWMQTQFSSETASR